MAFPFGASRIKRRPGERVALWRRDAFGAMAHEVLLCSHGVITVYNSRVWVAKVVNLQPR